MSTQVTGRDEVVRALRDAAPYTLAHQGRTAVVVAPFGPAGTGGSESLLGDLVLLTRVAGIRFALAYDVRGRVLGGDTLAPGRIPVDGEALARLREAAAAAREEIESVLSDGMPGLTGMGTVAGPMPSARKVGFSDGDDLGLMGTPKPFKNEDAASMLETGKAVLLPPLGRGPGGDTLHLDAREVALSFAAACKVDKLIVMVDAAEMDALAFRELTVDQAREALGDGGFGAAKPIVELGIDALDRGVGRVHFIDGAVQGGLLLELMSPDGVAAMLSKDPFDAVRMATPADVSSVAELIAPGVSSGALAPRTRQDLADTIGNFAVVARDDALIACASMERHGDSAEFGCLAVRADYANQAYGQLLLDFFEARGRKEGVTRMLVVTTAAADWFTERGYESCDVGLLPPRRRERVLEGKGERSAFALSKELG